MTPKPTHLIFDFDGTLADTFHHLVDICNILADEFNFKKISASEAKTLKNHSVLEVIHQLHVPLSKLPKIVKRAQEELQKDIGNIHPFDNLNTTLQKLKSLNYNLGIITTNSTENVESFLKNHNLEFFDFIMTCSKIWGKNKALKKLPKEHAIPLEKALYIADETRDIEAAQKAGVRIAAVSWGYNTRKALENANPDYLLQQPEDLIQLVTPSSF